MAFYKGGASLNWEYLPEDFKTETEVVDDLEKKIKANPNHVLPPRKRGQTKPFGSTAITKKAATKKIESVKVKRPVHPRLYNITSLNNKKKTVAVSEHKVTKAAFQYLCTFEESKSKMWLCAKDVGDAQIGKYWEDFENELGGDYEWEEIEDCQPVKVSRAPILILI